MKKLLVILGPTATGKTDVAVKLGGRLRGELVACDSRQVYRGLDIGTGKTTSRNSKLKIKKGDNYWIFGGVKIWLYDICSPTQQYDVGQYIKDANKVVNKIFKEKKLPIVVGGTGLYLRGFLDGFSNLSVPINTSLREELSKMSVEQLQQKLVALSPVKFNELNDSDKKNPRRLLRSIEIITMYPYINTSQKLKIKNQKFEVLKIGLLAPRPVLYKKIDLRVLDWFKEGILKEVKNLMDQGVSLDRFRAIGLEYGLIAEYIENPEIYGNDLEKLIINIQTKIRNYAKRQITWFKKEPGVEWFDITDKYWQGKMEKRVVDWYNAR